MDFISLEFLKVFGWFLDDIYDRKFLGIGLVLVLYILWVDILFFIRRVVFFVWIYEYVGE